MSVQVIHRMDPRIKALWVQELRSGEREQGYNHLRHMPSDSTTPRYCCLGVLCEIAVAEGVIEAAHPVPSLSGTVYHYGEETDLLPSTVQGWAGFMHEDPSVEWRGSYEYLAGLNDAGVGFEQIADLIEAQL